MNQQDSAQHDAFVRLLSRHASRIYGFILTLSPNRSDADDIFQNTNVALWRRFETYQDGTNFRAWACQVAYLEVLNYRRQQRKQQVLLSEDALAALAQDALAAADQADQREEVLARCMSMLRRGDQQMIRRRYFEAQSPKQIAERTSRSVYSVYRALTRIHDSLLQCMQRALAGENSV